MAQNARVAIGGNDLTGTIGDWSKPFATISAAVTAAAAAGGTVAILIGPGTFTENGGIQLPDNVHLYGSGLEVTKIQSSLSFSSSKAILAPGNNSIIADLSVLGTVSGGATFQAPFGALALNSVSDNVRVQRCKFGFTVPGGSDGIYANRAGLGTWRFYNCIISTGYDCVTLINGGVVELYNCTLTSDGSHSNGIAQGISVTNVGAVRMVGGSITVSGGIASNTGAKTNSPGSTCDLCGVSLSTGTGGAANDLVRANGTLAINKVRRMDGQVLTVSGTIAYSEFRLA